MYSSRMRTARFGGHHEMSVPTPPPTGGRPLPDQTGSDIIPPCGQTNRCKNITFSQLRWWEVI